MMRLSDAFVAVLAVLLAPAFAVAQGGAPESPRVPTIGDPGAGLAYAREACARCHAVEAGERISPLPAATPFDVLGETPGITGRAITVWLTTFHPERTMPPIVVPRDAREDLIAHILDLGSR